MKFLEWNRIISNYFFNTANAGKNVYLYLTKKELISLAQSEFYKESDEEIWNDFTLKIRNGLPGSFSQDNIIDKAIYAHNEWKIKKPNAPDNIELKYPSYIIFLIFLVLPLVEIKGDYNSYNYYDRLDEFLTTNRINKNVRTRLGEIEILWTTLSAWANKTNNGELGFFNLWNFTHKNWNYVGKVFSQCVFPPSAIKKLPELFLQAGMIPDSLYQNEEIKVYLLQYASSILLLPKNVIELIRHSDTNELGQSIIDTASKEYSKWTGESHSTDEVGIRTKRNEIASRIYLQLQIFSNMGKIEFSYRIKSSNEFPEDLNFDGNDIREEKGGYSKTINLPFKNSFHLKDDFNKWIAKLPDKEVRLFISAGSIQLSTDYWIETDTLSKINWMYLLCKKIKHDIILSWAKNHCSKFEDESDFENMPDGYSLFKFLNPREGIDSIPELTIIREKSIHLASALEFDFRTFTNDFLPEVEIVNSDGTETVYMQYKNNEEKFFLEKKNSDSNRWLIPEDISLYSDFNVRADGETFSGNETTYKIISTHDSPFLLNENKLPKRNSFGINTIDNLAQYSLGSNVVGTNLIKQIPYQHLFRGTNEELFSENKSPTYVHSEGNLLLSFLTLKGITTAQDFYAAFEFLHSKYFGNKNQNVNFNYSKTKKASLNFLDYLGYLDYEYETKSIVVNPPQLVFIPAGKGRKVLLIGGRDESMVDTIIETAPKYHLQVELTKQFQLNDDLLLPDAITVKSFGTSQQSFGERNLIEFAKQLRIKYNPGELVQVNLQEFCSNIWEYAQDILKAKEATLTFEDWARYIFNPATLQFDKSVSESMDKNFSLFEYRLRPWEYYHRIWINQKCYSIDRNWGRYYILYKLNKQVILKGNKKVAIPTQMPLPRLLSESIMLCSGTAPAIRYIGERRYRIFENIPSIFITNLFHKLGQDPINCSSL